MAKAKKQEISGKTASAGAEKSSKKSVAKKPAKAAAAAAPMIDTSSAAEAAAKMIGRKNTLNVSQGDQRESASFKQLKDSLNKPASQGPSAFLQNTAPEEKKQNQSFGGRNQVGRNQTYGADVNRTGVPRRTGG